MIRRSVYYYFDDFTTPSTRRYTANLRTYVNAQNRFTLKPLRYTSARFKLHRGFSRRKINNFVELDYYRY